MTPAQRIATLERLLRSALVAFYKEDWTDEAAKLLEYRKPEPAVPVSVLRALVESWDRDSRNETRSIQSSYHLRTCARELESAISAAEKAIVK